MDVDAFEVELFSRKSLLEVAEDKFFETVIIDGSCELILFTPGSFLSVTPRLPLTPVVETRPTPAEDAANIVDATDGFFCSYYIRENIKEYVFNSECVSDVGNPVKIAVFHFPNSV